MHKSPRSILLVVLTLLSTVALGVTTIVASAGLSLAATTVTALIMGGSGTPDPDQEPGYVPNVSRYYIFPNSACQPDNCTLKSVVTPEEAWPLYGGLTARTWKQSILDGVSIYDAAVRTQIATADTNVVMFGYSQSGAILAIEKRALADDPTISQDQINKLQLVVIGNVSRPNGGLNGRLPDFTLPIVEFPFGPTMPTDTTIETTDIALKWDIIADAPLYVLNPLAMLNALVGGPGFGIVHGTYPNPEGVPPTGLVGGYTQEEWQTIMDDPTAYAALHPDAVNVQTYGDTTYITVTPKVLPLVVPLHSIGLGFVADLIEPALRVIIEETGYDRSIPYGQPTPFRLFPVFDPIKLAVDVLAAIPAGIEQALNNLGGGSMLAPTTTTKSALAMSFASADPSATVDVTRDGTTDPVSGSTTSIGASTTLQKTGVETEGDASGTNATQSQVHVIKQEDMTQQQEEETPGGTTNDAVGTRKDTVETTKNTVGTTKEPVETTKNTVGTTKGTVGTKNASGGRVSLTLSTNGSTAKDPKTDTPDERNGATRTTTPADTDSENAA
jgi:hypothetical protein